MPRRSVLAFILPLAFAACLPRPYLGGGYAVTAPVESATTASAEPSTSDDSSSDGGSQCKSAYGTTVCGYDCVAAYGEVRCAATPEGSCTAGYGEVTCWDPPRREHRHHRRYRRDDDDGDDDDARSECKSAYGTTACGYGCVAAYGEVKCASRPGGVCQAAYGEITCS